MNQHEEFLKAYNDYPSQDNEGYVPNRGGFKCGFGAGWDIQQKEIDRLKSDNLLLKKDVATYMGSLLGKDPPSAADFINAFKKLIDERDQLKFERDEFEVLANSWMNDFDKLKSRYEPMEIELSGLQEHQHVYNKNRKDLLASNDQLRHEMHMLMRLGEIDRDKLEGVTLENQGWRASAKTICDAIDCPLDLVEKGDQLREKLDVAVGALEKIETLNLDGPYESIRGPRIAIEALAKLKDPR